MCQREIGSIELVTMHCVFVLFNGQIASKSLFIDQNCLKFARYWHRGPLGRRDLDSLILTRCGTPPKAQNWTIHCHPSSMKQLTGSRQPVNWQLTRGPKRSNCNWKLFFLQLIPVTKERQLMVVRSLKCRSWARWRNKLDRQSWATKH